MPRISRLMLVLSLFLTVSYTARGRSDDLLDAILASKVELLSLEGEALFESIGAFRTLGVGQDLEGPITLTKGRVKVFYDRGKYHLRIQHDKRLVFQAGRNAIVDAKTDEVVIVYDGQVAYEVVYSKDVGATESKGAIYNELAVPIRGNDIFAIDPARLWRNNNSVENLVNVSGQGIVVTDANVVDKDSKVIERHELQWKNIDGEWCPTKATSEFPLATTAKKYVWEFITFEPNKPVDPSLFEIDRIEVPVGTEFTDRRNNTRNSILYKAAKGFSDVRPGSVKYLYYDPQLEVFVISSKLKDSLFLRDESLRSYLQARAVRLVRSIDEVCSLSDSQKQALNDVFRLHDSSLVSEINRLANEMNSEPSIGFGNPNRINALTLRLQQFYLAAGSLCSKVAETKLDQSQKQLLHHSCLTQFVEKLDTCLPLTSDQNRNLTAFINELAKTKSSFVFDPKDYLELLLDADRTKLVQILGEYHSKRISETGRRSKSIDVFFRDLSTVGSSRR